MSAEPIPAPTPQSTAPNPDAIRLPERIGRTPLVRLPSLEPRPGVEVYAKAEWVNPGGSVKDRAALAMIRDGERSGRLTRDRVLIDASSGNTGIAYAMLGRAFGYAVTIVLPANAGAARKRLLERYGAAVIETDPVEGIDGAIAEAERRHAADPSGTFYPDQYDNPNNWLAHFHGTGPEILTATHGRVTHFVAGLGTSGTFMGTGRRLRTADASIRLIAVQPDSPLHGLEGLKHMATARVPAIYDPGLADGHLTVGTEAAREARLRLARAEGIRVGPSSGAAAAAAVEVASGLSRGVVVTVFPDGACKYDDEPEWRMDP